METTPRKKEWFQSTFGTREEPDELQLIPVDSISPSPFDPRGQTSELRLIRTEEINRIKSALIAAIEIVGPSEWTEAKDGAMSDLIQAQNDIAAVALLENRQIPPEIEGKLEIQTRIF
jgi:hypothetical protein